MVATGVAARSLGAPLTDGFQVVESKKRGKKTSADIAHEQTQQSLKILFSLHIGSGRRDPRVKRATKELSEQPPWAYTSESVALDNGPEFFYHPDVYKTVQCHGGAGCQKRQKEYCPFLHPGEVFEPFWRCRGSRRAGREYVPPHSITYLAFKHLMLNVKVRANGMCTCTDTKHKRDRCEKYHDESDVRDPVQLTAAGKWKGLPPGSSLMAVALHPQRYKSLLCGHVERRLVCTLDRMCTFLHSEAEAEKVARFWARLRQDMLDAPPAPQLASAPVRKGSAAFSVASDQCSLGGDSTCSLDDHVAVLADADDLLTTCSPTTVPDKRLIADLFWRLPAESVEAFFDLCTKTLAPATQPRLPPPPGHMAMFPGHSLAPLPAPVFPRPAPAAAAPPPIPASRSLPSAHHSDWAVDDVERWVLGLEEGIVHSAASSLRASGVDGAQLAGLDHQRLQAMGMASFGIRHKLLAAIRALPLPSIQ